MKWWLSFAWQFDSWCCVAKLDEPCHFVVVDWLVDSLVYMFLHRIGRGERDFVIVIMDDFALCCIYLVWNPMLTNKNVETCSMPSSGVHPNGSRKRCHPFGEARAPCPAFPGRKQDLWGGGTKLVEHGWWKSRESSGTKYVMSINFLCLNLMCINGFDQTKPWFTPFCFQVPLLHSLMSASYLRHDPDEALRACAWTLKFERPLVHFMVGEMLRLFSMWHMDDRRW